MAENSLFPFDGCREDLLLLCYRMGGSLLEAEGLAEETLLLVGGLYRAEGAPTCTELLKDAARKCAVSLADRPPRGLPRLYGAPSDPGLPPCSHGRAIPGSNLFPTTSSLTRGWRAGGSTNNRAEKVLLRNRYND